MIKNSNLAAKLTDYRRLLRVEQWYKNLIIFLPLLFAPPAHRYPVSLHLLAFVGFCCLSSLSYIMNDWRDRKEDALHPTKKTRPLGSGKISGRQAFIIAVLLAIVVILSIYTLGAWYGILAALYTIITSSYTYGLKNIPVLDILLITTNFIIRELAGITTPPNFDQAINFAAVFFVILILLTHKRRSDNKLMQEKAASHKPVLQFYTARASYLIRITSYLGLTACLYMLIAQNNASIIKIITFAIFFIFTSILLSKDPRLVMKPHYLPRLWYWDLALIVTLFVVLLK